MKKNFISFAFASLLFHSVAFSQTTDRVTLIETFTSSTCPPCNPGNVQLEGLLDDEINEDKYTSLKYQMSWPGTGDPYYTVEGGSRRGFYGISGVPSSRVDGELAIDPRYLTQEQLNDAYAVPSEIELKAYYNVNEATQTVSIQVDLKALADISSSGGLFLRVAIFENRTANNAKTNGETKFEHVMKKMLPTATGTYLGGMDANETMTFDFEHTFPGAYRLPPNAENPINNAEEHSIEEFSDLGVVVWVQRNTTKEVYQSTYALNGFAGVSQNTVTPDFLSVYPNPTHNSVNVSFQTAQTSNRSTLSILDFTGKVVYQEEHGNLSTNLYTTQINTQNFDSGVYFVKLTSEHGQKTKKLSIIH